MIKINETIKNNESIEDNIQKELEFLTSFISYQKNLKGYISNNFDTISLNLDTKNSQTDEITDFFQKVFEARLNIDCNIINLQKLFRYLKKIDTRNKFDLLSQVTEYNKLYNNYFSDIKSKTKSSKKIADDLYKFLNTKSKKTKKISDVPEFDLEPIEDNLVLKVSEKTGKVYLPFLVDDLKKVVSENPDKYSCLRDLINKKYIIPLSYYKNSSYARFKEAYKLIREKEDGSITEAFNLAFELLFNYNLDPTIISACKNVDELDIYLDCLEDNEIDEFYCFDIIYEVAPLIKNPKKQLI